MTDSAVSMAPPESTASSRTKNTLQAICGVPGVSHAVTMDQDGIPRGEVGDHGQALAGRGLYLATIIGAPIGEALGLGDLLVAALHGGPDKMLLFKSRGNYLTVALAPEASLDSVETGIRQAVSPRTGVK